MGGLETVMSFLENECEFFVWGEKYDKTSLFFVFCLIVVRKYKRERGRWWGKIP